MKPNPILAEMTLVEKKFYEWYKEVAPSSAYNEGASECAGRFFIPSKQNLDAAEEKLKGIVRQAQNKEQKRLFKSHLAGLRFNEPYMVLGGATNAFFTHLVKEGIVIDHLTLLARQVGEALDAFAQLLSERKWTIETRILTCQHSDQLIGILETIISESTDDALKKSLTALKEKTAEYRKLYNVEDVKQGDFTEVFPILQKTRGRIKHKTIYPKLLADLWGYSEKPEQIERKAKLWLKQELPNLQETTRKLAKIYRVKSDVETVDEALDKRRGIPKEQALKFVKETRGLAQRVFENNMVKITPKYDTRVIETPRYLVSMFPSAALLTFDSFTDKPFNMFLVTTDPRFSPSSSVPELISSLLHEEYGHAVNFSNSVTRFAAKPTFSELIPSMFAIHISDGISFHREYEFVELLKKLAKKRTLGKDEEAFFSILKGENDTATMLLENEFVMQKWRIMRFLRAIFDVQINMEKQSVADFVEWAHTETGLSEKMIYDQTWIFLESVGYAPCYSVEGDRIRRLQQRAVEKGISQIDFNTYVASLGFPAPELFERKVHKHIVLAKEKPKPAHS